MAGWKNVTRRMAAALMVGFIATIGVVAMVPWTTAAASTVEGPSLELTPPSGPPGAGVVAVARGYESCPPTGLDDVGFGSVDFLWDGESLLRTVQVDDDGSATADFAVPLDAQIESHVVVARCAEAGTLEFREEFAVTPPVVQVLVPTVIGMTLSEATTSLRLADLGVGAVTGEGVVKEQTPESGVEVVPASTVDLVLAPVPPVTVRVPSVVGRTLADAEAILKDAELALGQVVGDTGEVSEQSPAAGVAVEKGRLVDVVLVAAPDEFVTVPDLQDRSVADAQELLVGLGLTLGTTVGDGDLVRSQAPPPLTRVLPGSSVNINTGPGPARRLVRVPDLKNLTLDESRRVLEAVGLVLFEGSPSEERVVSQQPAAKVLVPRGSTVAVTVDQPPLVPPDPGPPIAAMVVVAVLVAATAGAVQWRRTAERRWLRAHVLVAGRPGLVRRPLVEADLGAVGLGQPVVQLRGVRGRGARIVVSEVE